jgi:hypothetical protein
MALNFDSFGGRIAEVTIADDSGSVILRARNGERGGPPLCCPSCLDRFT